MRHEHIERADSRQAPEAVIIEKLNELGFIKQQASEPPIVMPEINGAGFEELSSQQMNELRELVFRAQLYLSRPLIVDNFGNDDDKRDEWVKQMAKDHGEAFKDFYQRNKLRGNSITMFYNHFKRVGLFLQDRVIQTPEAKRLIELIDSLPQKLEGYHAIESTPEKIVLAGTITRILQSCVELLAVKKVH